MTWLSLDNMVRTKFSQRKTSGPEPTEQPPSKSVKKSADIESEVVQPEAAVVDSAAVILDLTKVQEATKTLPKIPKIIKTEPAENSEVEVKDEIMVPPVS